jgi:hypothetical protein
MARVTELRIRADWGLVKVAYLPALAAGMGASKFFWPLILFSFRIAPCGLCVLLSRWGNHVEEWMRCKPLFQITDFGLRYEDGGAPAEYDWSDIVGIVMHRRNTIPPWRTNGSTEITPPFWLSISVRGEPPRLIGSQDGYLDRERYLEHYSDMTGELIEAAAPTQDNEEVGLSTEGYIDRSRYLGPATDDCDSSTKNEGDGDITTICVWPRQVVGGLFSLVRFARELQLHLIERSERGEIPSLLPPKGIRA